MSSMTDSSFTLPPLPELQVIRDTWFSQTETDAALAYLWHTAPHLVHKQLQLEHLDYDQTYLMELTRIIDFFRKADKGAVTIPSTHLGLQDLLFELSRRLRKVRRLPEWIISGRPLADSPNATLRSLPALPVRKTADNHAVVEQELADRIIDSAYQARPDLFYAFAESLRRGGIGPHDIFNDLVHLVQSVSKPEDNIDSSKAFYIGGEINRRLRKVCDLASV